MSGIGARVELCRMHTTAQSEGPEKDSGVESGHWHHCSLSLEVVLPGASKGHFVAEQLPQRKDQV